MHRSVRVGMVLLELRYDIVPPSRNTSLRTKTNSTRWLVRTNYKWFLNTHPELQEPCTDKPNQICSTVTILKPISTSDNGLLSQFTRWLCHWHKASDMLSHSLTLEWLLLTHILIKLLIKYFRGGVNILYNLVCSDWCKAANKTQGIKLWDIMKGMSVTSCSVLQNVEYSYCIIQCPNCFNHFKVKFRNQESFMHSAVEPF